MKNKEVIDSGFLIKTKEETIKIIGGSINGEKKSRI